MVIYTKEESVNEDELYNIGIKKLKEQFRLLRYSILIYPLIMGMIYYITQSNSLYFIAFFIITEFFLMLGFLNYNKTIKYNDKLNTTEGVAQYEQKNFNDGDGEVQTISIIRVNGIAFNIPSEVHEEVSDKLVRLYYLNSEDSLVVGLKYLQ